MGSADAATIDVLIPVYNAVGTVEAAIRSIADQTLRDLSIVVVDDGSTDGTADVLARLAAADPRIRVVTQPNGGIVAALNAALALARAPYVARHDADDVAFPNRLEVQLAFLAAHPDVVAVGANSAHIDATGRRTGHVTRFVREVRGDPRFVPSIEPYLSHPFLLARRDALVAAGGYRYCFHSEDTDLYWRLSDVGTLANVTDVLGEYRMHAGSVSSKSIVNGRIAAVSSQLAAVSEERRRAGRADLTFSRDALARYHEAAEFDAILDAASTGLDAAERRWLEAASAAKLIELSSYRPYRLTPNDRRTVRRLLERHYRWIDRFNRRQLIFRLLLNPSRLARRPLETLSMVPWSVMPDAVGNAIAQRTRRILRLA